MEETLAILGGVELSADHQRLLGADAEPNAMRSPSSGEEVPPHPPALTVEGATVLPRPGASGQITGRDGRAYHVADMAALAARLNRQEPKVRIDVDHRSEPGAYPKQTPMACLSSAALGWVRNWREENGRLLADLDLQNYWSARGVLDRTYRYLSAALLLNESKEVTGISSVALTNWPNLRLPALNYQEEKESHMDKDKTDSAPAPGAAGAAELEAARESLAAAEREKTELQTRLDRRDDEAIDDELNAAVERGAMLPAQKDAYRSMAVEHRGGKGEGLNHLRKALAAAGADFAHLRRPSAPKAGQTESDALTATELQACRLTNTPPEAYREIKKTTGPDDLAYVEVPMVSRGQVEREIRRELNAANIGEVALNATVTPTLLTDLDRMFRNEFNVGFAMAKSFYETICMTVSSAGKGNVYGWMEDLPEMQEWTGNRTVQSISSKAYKLDNKDYELTIGVGRNDIEDDQVGVYMPRFQRMGEAASTKMDDLVRDALANGHSQTCHDGQYFFDTDHPVKDAKGVAAQYANKGTVTDGKPAWVLLDLRRIYKPFIMQVRQPMRFVSMDQPTDENVFTKKQYRYGVDCRMVAGYGLYHLAYVVQKDLTDANVKAVIKAMRGQLSQTGDRPLGVNPSHILVPPSQEFTARKLFEVPGKAGTEDNELYKRLQIIDTDWMADVSYA